MKNIGSKILFTVLALSVVGTAVSSLFTLSRTVETQSIAHQRALSPAFDFVISEVVKPLFTVQGIAHSSTLRQALVATPPDPLVVTQELQRLEQKYGYEFFAASEHLRRQINSDGSGFPLIEGAVDWYFRLKDHDQDVLATLGKRDNPQVYFDVKVYDDAQNFVGFVGLGQDLSTIQQTFKQYQDIYNYEIIFIDHNDDIMLSTDESIVADTRRIVGFDDLPWVKALSDAQKQLPTLNNQIVHLDDATYLIAEVKLDEIDWRLFLLNPLHKRQGDSIDEFAAQTLIVVLMLLTGFYAAKLGLHVWQNEFVGAQFLDPLTGAKNRKFLDKKFERLRQRDQALCMIMMDIDHFKTINDTYGHIAGDTVLKNLAGILQDELRDEDDIVRLGGEEFLLLLPNLDQQVGEKVAERMRRHIERTPFDLQAGNFSVTASFGVYSVNHKDSLTFAVDRADKALYRAKNAGRNQVVSFHREDAKPNSSTDANK